MELVIGKLYIVTTVHFTVYIQKVPSNALYYYVLVFLDTCFGV
jgi:hypothetical protein